MEEKQEGTTIAPLVWLSGVMMAIEVIKIVLGRGKLALAPKFKVFDPLNYRLPE